MGTRRLGMRDTLRVLYGFLEGHRGAFALGFLLLVASRAAGLVAPLVWKTLFDDVLLTQDAARLPVVLGALVAVMLARVLLNRLGVDLASYRVLAAQATLKRRLHEKLVGQSLGQLHAQRTGDLVQRAYGDVGAVGGNIQRVLLLSSLQLFELVVSVGFIAWLDWRLGLLTAVPLAVGVAYVRRFHARVGDTYREVHRARGALLSQLADDLAVLPVIKGFAREGERGEAYRRAVADELDRERGCLVGRELFHGTFEVAGWLSNLAIMSAGAVLVLRGELSVGALVAVRTYWGAIWFPVTSLAETSDVLNRTRAATERIVEILDAPAEVRYPEPAPGAPALPRAVELRVEGVDFSYAPGRPALSGVDLVAPPGTRVAVVGPSGAGKSTLFALLLRFHDPDAGRVLVDGVDLRELPREHYPGLFAPVEQTPLLFAASVGENVAFPRPGASDAAVREALRRANAWEFVERLPQGVDTPVGERGVRLSGGQKQRLCIARAFLADPRVLLLDEATAAVEAESEAQIQQALDRLMAGRTTLMSTHKMHLARGCDQILVIEAGRVTAQGSHHELLRKSPWYARTAALQGDALRAA